MRDYSLDRTKSKSGKKHTKKYVIPLTAVILLIIILISALPWKKFNFGTISIINTTDGHIVEDAKTEPTKPIPTDIPKSASVKELISNIRTLTQSIGGTTAYYVYDIKKHKGFGDNENMVITAASVNKIAILASLYYLAGKGEVDLEKIVVPQPSDIQDYGSGTIRYDPPGSPYSLKTLARLMIEKSDNTAAYIIAGLIIGTDKIQNMVNDWGLMQTDFENNKTSAHDMGILMTKMYNGEITTRALTKEMLGLMQKSDYDDRIPMGLDGKYNVYHKTGDDIGKIHDTAIIELPNKPYYLGIFTLDVTDESATKKVMADLTRMVNNYMKDHE